MYGIRQRLIGDQDSVPGFVSAIVTLAFIIIVQRSTRNTIPILFLSFTAFAQTLIDIILHLVDKFENKINWILNRKLHFRNVHCGDTAKKRKAKTKFYLLFCMLYQKTCRKIPKNMKKNK